MWWDPSGIARHTLIFHVLLMQNWPDDDPKTGRNM
jgi:hypothetical protein